MSAKSLLDERDAKRRGVRLPNAAPKTEVHVDRRLGIYCIINDTKKFYPKVKSRSQIFKALLHLVERKEPVDIATLAERNEQDPRSLKRSIKDFNEKFRHTFDTKVDPILDTTTGLYYANIEHFNFM